MMTLFFLLIWYRTGLGNLIGAWHLVTLYVGSHEWRLSGSITVPQEGNLFN